MQKQAASEHPVPIVTRHSLTEDQKRRVRILLAEDNVTNQKVALSIIGKLGYRADAVANGKEAVEALKMIPYDIVLMDCQMPEMDGYEATKEIRNLKSMRDSRVPIIAMTAHAMQGDREKCLAVGMDDYIAKPVRPQALSDMLEAWITKQEASPITEAIACNVEPKPDVFDKTSLLNRLMGDEALAEEILGEFMEDVPRKFVALKEALGNGDAAAVHHQAHTLKGASANVGASALEKIAYQVEVAGEAGDLTEAGMLVSQLEKQFEILRKTME
jgi:CheY-like chemotaxis protein/HPt (histidine-containing phosphotransfer) domain-containing protein